ncbi:lysozyme inhibitor LprI family protein [Massilia eurypsychrophila]|nr:lysozyme inhibitor LprI family protein [Massilia eurypsychrophila]
MRFTLTTMLALLVALPALAQSSYPNTDNFGVPVDRDAGWYMECMRVKHVGPPAIPTTSPPAACNASGAYYDKLDQAITSAAEWGRVRSCAIASNDTAVLAMLYANGLGVKRDVARATRYACSTAAAMAETDGRVNHLLKLRAGERFDHCDDITSGMMGGVCAGIDSTRADKVRKVFLARVRRELPAPHKPAFDRLVKSGAAFATAHASDETSTGGTGYAGFVIAAEARENEWLREHLAAFEKNRFDLPPSSRFDADDAELNRVYAELIKSDRSDRVAAAAIRATQRSWLAYRDAWVAFATLRYPLLPADSLKAVLTQWRIKQLKRL